MSSDSLPRAYLNEIRSGFDQVKSQTEEALAQIDDEKFFMPLRDGDNSAAIIVKHMAGNLRSRFLDFLTSDGEKPDRRRDTEFELEGDDSRQSLMRRWEDSWTILAQALDQLGDGDLLRTVTVRDQPHSVLEALQRQLMHHSSHAGQVVFLAKHLNGGRWRTLSIPKGQSEEFNAEMRRRFAQAGQG